MSLYNVTCLQNAINPLTEVLGHFSELEYVCLWHEFWINLTSDIFQINSW